MLPASVEGFDWEIGIRNVQGPSMPPSTSVDDDRGKIVLDKTEPTQAPLTLVPSDWTTGTTVDPQKRKGKKSNGATMLPIDFEPHPYSVLCGQGNENYNATGMWLPLFLASHLAGKVQGMRCNTLFLTNLSVCFVCYSPYRQPSFPPYRWQFPPALPTSQNPQRKVCHCQHGDGHPL